MTEGAIHTLPFGEEDGVLLDGMHHLAIASLEEVLSKEKVPIAPIPDDASIFEFQFQSLWPECVGELAQLGHVFGITRR